eukprot:5751660-Pyramimonas_sp.AAC.1
MSSRSQLPGAGGQLLHLLAIRPPTGLPRGSLQVCPAGDGPARGFEIQAHRCHPACAVYSAGRCC